MHLAQESIDVFDLAQHAGRDDEVDRVGAEERKVGRVAFVPLDRTSAADASCGRARAARPTGRWR